MSLTPLNLVLKVYLKHLINIKMRYYAQVHDSTLVAKALGESQE
jgi:hypothetical protein